MKVQVNRETCQGHNRCSMTCPEIYKIDAEGYAFVEVEEVPTEHEENARRALETCPENAISMIE